MPDRQAYKKKVQIAFVDDDGYTEIEQSKIVYILIQHYYEDYVMPVIYLKIAVETDLYAKIVEEKDSAKIYLRIQTFDAYSNTSIDKDDINQQFTYILPSTTPEYTTNLADTNENVDSAYRIVTMGLLDMTIMNTLRKTFGGVYKDIDQYTLIYSALEDTKAIIKTPTYNTVYENIIVPSLSSRKDMLDWIFGEDPFYDTEFLYFIDYNVSYLLDRTGEAVSAGDGSLDTVTIDIRDVTAREAYYEGMQEINNSYYIYVNPANTNVTIDTGTEKVANQLVAGLNDDTSNIVDLNINMNAESTTHQTFDRFKNIGGAVVYKNAVESAQVCITFGKENIDTNVITPNKAFLVKNYEGYSDYNGRYLLSFKNEVIRGAAEDFTTIVTVGLKKVNNIQQIGIANSSESSVNSSKITYSTAQTDTYSTRSTVVTTSKKTTTTSSTR